MAVAVDQSYFHDALVERRELLRRASAAPDSDIARLLADVDAALARLDHGDYGVCLACGGQVQTDRLVRDPLAQYCAEHPGAAEDARLRRDLALARQIQRRLLPRPDAAIGAWRYTYRYESAGEVGGDFCDIIPRPARGETLVLVGDVSGKGIAASMLMSHLLATFRSLAPLDLPAGDLMSRVNDLFHDSVPSTVYATLAVAALHDDGGADLYSAGHWTPILRTGATTVRTNAAPGLPIGLFAGARYGPARLSLSPGDALLFFTDGAIDAETDDGDNYGADRLVRAFASAEADLSVAVDRVLDELHAFQSPTTPQDDLLLFGVAPARV